MKNIPFIMGAPSNDRIILGPLIVPNKTISFTELVPPPVSINDQIISDIKEINKRFIASIIDPYNAIAGKMVLAEIIKYFTNFQKACILGNVKIFNTETWELMS